MLRGWDMPIRATPVTVHVCCCDLNQTPMISTQYLQKDESVTCVFFANKENITLNTQFLTSNLNKYLIFKKI